MDKQSPEEEYVLNHQLSFCRLALASSSEPISPYLSPQTLKEAIVAS